MAIEFLRDAGVLGNTPGVLHTVEDTETLISIVLFNDHSSAVTVSFYIAPLGGTARQFFEQSLASKATLTFDSKALMLDTDEIQGEASVTSVVTYWISTTKVS